MKIDQVAIQLYTLRDFCKTPADIASTIKRVREIGYQSVQLSGLGPHTEEEIVAICKGEGVTICATHEPSQLIVDNVQAVIDRLGKLGCKYTAYPYPAYVDLTKPEVVVDLAHKLDKAGAQMRAAGQVLGYHNHAIEFFKPADKTVFDIILEESSPENLVAELDTYWCHFGGCDVVDWCHKLKGRLPFIHLKDYLFSAENKPAFGEIGYGNLNFQAIITAAEDSGCQWFIVEQDECPGDPFDSIKKSFDYIAANLVALT